MTCGGCAAAIKRAIARVDPGAAVDVDLKGGQVHVQSRWGGWLPLTASECQTCGSCRTTTSEGSHPDGDYNDRPGSRQERFSGSRG
ncbi:cation transporter [Phenylobacterium zucineum]|uniref:cation transporter n=1 Tax=Phenylobacterium zucineum TaxID=284016 RepID=UPI001F168F5E|nr:cation transporter [Phenylobacterium zucineum]